MSDQAVVVQTQETKFEYDPIPFNKTDKRNQQVGKGVSGTSYRIEIDKKADRWVLFINDEVVKHDPKGAQGDGKGCSNQLCTHGARGWYYIKDVKGFAGTYEMKLQKDAFDKAHKAGKK